MASSPAPDRHQVTPYPLRLPIETKSRLTAAAAKNHRSLNGEIAVRLEHSLDATDRVEAEGAQP